MVVKRRASSLPPPETSTKQATRRVGLEKVKKGSKAKASALDAEQADVVVTPFDKYEQKLLMARGVPYSDLPSGSKFSVSEYLTKIEVMRGEEVERQISPARQLRALNAILANPIRGSYVICISSYHSDLRAKQLTAMIVHAALNTTKARSSGKPFWHRVYGGLGDPMRDKSPNETPSLLVISNVVKDCSAFKLEKVRDLLEKYSHIPRIVVYGGEDPFTLFRDRLHSPLNAGIYLGPGKRRTSQI